MFLNSRVRQRLLLRQKHRRSMLRQHPQPLDQHLRPTIQLQHLVIQQVDFPRLRPVCQAYLLRLRLSGSGLGTTLLRWTITVSGFPQQAVISDS